MAIAAYDTAVKADIDHGSCGDKLKLRAEKILLHNSVFFIEELEDIEFHKLAAAVASERQTSHKDIELLTLDALRKRAL